ncbi:MAG: hypothetical protein ACYTFP_06090, partial [Planctomycetota bacterium]
MQRQFTDKKLTAEEHIKNAGLILDFDEIARKGGMSKEEVLIAKKAIAKMANKHSCGKISVTTRQSLQYHKIQMNNLPEMLRDMKKAGLTTFHGCGDVARNVAACPWASVCEHRRFDVLPYTKETAKLLSESRDLDNLPRKYKVTFSGCGANCGQPFINCMGAIAIVRKNAQG